MKNVIKKLCLAFVLVFSMTVLTGCSKTDKAEKLVKNMFSAYKAQENLGEYFTSEDEEFKDTFNWDEDGEEDDQTKMVKEAFERLADSLSYEIISSEENEETGNCEVKLVVNSLDFSNVFTKYFAEAFTLAFSGKSEEETTEALNRIIQAEFDNANENIDIEVTYIVVDTEEGMKIEMNADVMNSLFGNLLKPMYELAEAFSSTGE